MIDSFQPGFQPGFQAIALPVSIGGAPALTRFIPAVDEAIATDDKKREAARRKRRLAAAAEAQAVIAVAMADQLNRTRRLNEEDWLLGLTDDAEYVRRAA